MRRVLVRVGLDNLDVGLEDKELFLLKHLLKQMKTGAMPPEDVRQPKKEEHQTIVDWTVRALEAGERRVRDKHGSVRRLTVEQYRNTLRDLLGVEDLLADALPADGISKEGFKNNKDTLLLTPQMMETYFEIAEQALELCIVDEKSKPRIQCFRVEVGSGINENPTPDHIELEGPRLLPKTDFIVRQVTPDKPFAFERHLMRTKYRFNEGYRGNATVRGWKEFEGLHHAVFTTVIGQYTKGGFHYGRSHHFVPEGLLLCPRTTLTNEHGHAPVRGPAPTFSMPVRELPKSGMFQVTVEAARYDDGLQVFEAAKESSERFVLDVPAGQPTKLEIPRAGVYQLDAILGESLRDDVIVADIGKRTFSKRLKGKFPPDGDGDIVVPFLIARFEAGTVQLTLRNGDGRTLRRAHFTRVPDGSQAAREFASFERRVPHLSVHLGVRTDVGARLSMADRPKPVPSSTIERYSFHAPISSFASPDTEEDNPNYLAGLRELAIRSEPTDTRQMPRVLVHAVEFEGPYYESWPPPAHRKIFFRSPDRSNPTTYARQIIDRFASRAYRRSPTAKELDNLLAVWRTSFEEHLNFQESIRDTLLVILTSPQFLFLVEKSADPKPE
ncbi:MAG: DUF1587 domain-containing protein, partial [Planctomycetota bacterium]